jgi:hypothetical protein
LDVEEHEEAIVASARGMQSNEMRERRGFISEGDPVRTRWHFQNSQQGPQKLGSSNQIVRPYFTPRCSGVAWCG